MSSAILAAAAQFSAFNATQAYARPLDETHIARIQRQIGERMRELAPSGKPTNSARSARGRPLVVQI